MDSSADGWIVGSSGIFTGSPGSSFERLGFFDFNTNAVLRSADGLIVGVNCGVFRVDVRTAEWTQLHDETVTEVLAVAPHSGDLGVVVGCPYGLASGVILDGAVRWLFHSDALTANRRFTTALLRLGTADDYLLGTEGGILVARGVPTPSAGWEGADLAWAAAAAPLSAARPGPVRWEFASLPSVPVRALLEIEGRYFAGTDGLGIWTSGDGLLWRPAGCGADDRTVLSLAYDGESIVAGTDCGLLVGNGSGVWRALGPGVLVSSVAAAPGSPGAWLSGCRPSGLWWTENAGRRFAQVGALSNVGAILPPAHQE